MSYKSRILSNDYTESDVALLFLDGRERARINSFVREVGDFIAHKERAKGASLDRCTDLYVQLAFMQEYSRRFKGKTINTRGECPWWFQRFLLTRLRQCSEKVLKRKLNSSRSDLKSEIQAWFPDPADKGERGPTRIFAKNLPRFEEIVSVLAAQLRVEGVFQWPQTRREVENLLNEAGLGSVDSNHIILAVAVLLTQQKQVKIDDDVSATISLQIYNRDVWSAEEGKILPNKYRSKASHFLGDGLIELCADIDMPFLESRRKIRFGFLQTRIHSRNHLDKRLLKVEHPGMGSEYCFDSPLGFQSNPNSLIYPLEQKPK